MKNLALSMLFVPLFLASSAMADAPAPAPAATITVADPWVRLPPPRAKNTGAFMVIKNAGDTDRKVVGASATISKVVELHTHLSEGGVMKMRKIPAIDVKAKGEAVLKPGGLHVMFIDLTTALKEGQQVAITLELDDGSKTVVKAPVRKFDAPPAAQMH